MLGGAFPAESGKLGQVLRELYKGARRASAKGRLLRGAAAGERCERGTGNLRAEERREETARGLSVGSGRREAMRGHQEGRSIGCHLFFFQITASGGKPRFKRAGTQRRIVNV